MAPLELTVFTPTNQNSGKKSMPEMFSEPVRGDLIRRASEAVRANNRQSYGASPEAGNRHAVDISRRRRDYKGSYGKGIARVPRKILSRNGAQFNWVGARAPSTVGGRRAHPPKSAKILSVKINTKERKKAIRSALSATMIPKIVLLRGHRVPKAYPFLLDASFENIAKAKDAFQSLCALGLEEELNRVHDPTIRAGLAKSRGRRLKRAVGPLVLVSSSCNLSHALANVPGVDVLPIREANCNALAPGSHPGRLTLITTKALEEISSKKLFQ